jgi:hypothetical protein
MHDEQPQGDRDEEDAQHETGDRCGPAVTGNTLG